jgi:hypothetical protein
VWNGLVGVGVVAGSSRALCGWVVGGVARCWALRNQASLFLGLLCVLGGPGGGAPRLVLFGCWIVDASIFYSCLLRLFPWPLVWRVFLVAPGLG